MNEMRVGFYPICFMPNQMGSGIAMTVKRGIPCEGHTQVFSAHCTNDPVWEFVVKAVEENKHAIEEAYGEMCTFFSKMSVIKKDCWETKEAIAAVFLTWLVKQVADESERLEFEHDKLVAANKLTSVN